MRTLPNLLLEKIAARKLIQMVLALLFFVVYLFPGTRFILRSALSNVMQPWQHVLLYRESAKELSSDPILSKLSLSSVSDSNCYTPTFISCRHLVTFLRELKSELGGRTLVITELPGFNPGATHFLADIPVQTSVIEPVLSVWVPSEEEHWWQEILRKKPQCLLANQEDRLLKRWVSSFRANPVHVWMSPLKVSLYCK